MILTTPELILRPQLPADAPFLLAILSDPEAMRFWNRAPITDPAVVEGLMAEQQAAMAAGLCRYWTLFERDDAVGSIDLSLIGDGAAELGFLLRRDRWGRGLASQAAAAVAAHAFGGLGLTRLAAAALTENHAARRVLEKTGFALVERRAARLAGGQVADCAFYALQR